MGRQFIWTKTDKHINYDELPPAESLVLTFTQELPKSFISRDIYQFVDRYVAAGYTGDTIEHTLRYYIRELYLKGYFTRSYENVENQQNEAEIIDITNGRIKYTIPNPVRDNDRIIFNLKEENHRLNRAISDSDQIMQDLNDQIKHLNNDLNERQNNINQLCDNYKTVVTNLYNAEKEIKDLKVRLFESEFELLDGSRKRSRPFI